MNKVLRHALSGSAIASGMLLAASPAATIAQHVGHALMVVRADVTSERALRDALSLIAGCNQIQLLLNGVKFSPSGRSFGSYYGYGE